MVVCRGVPELTMTHRPMWQLLIELCCRHNSVSQALQVITLLKKIYLIYVQARVCLGCACESF